MQKWLKDNLAGEKAGRSIASFLFLLLLPVLFLVPVLILALSSVGEDVASSTAVLVAFSMAFSIVMIRVTPAKPHEVLNASAAYLAVLVVFYGSVNTNEAFSKRGGFRK